MTQKPFAKIRVSGGIQIVFWERETTRGDQKITVLQPSITGSWLDKEGKWQNRSVNFASVSQLYELMAAAGEVRAVHKEFKDHTKSEASEPEAESGDIEEPQQILE